MAASLIKTAKTSRLHASEQQGNSKKTDLKGFDNFSAYSLDVTCYVIAVFSCNTVLVSLDIYRVACSVYLVDFGPLYFRSRRPSYPSKSGKEEFCLWHGRLDKRMFVNTPFALFRKRRKPLATTI